MGGHAHAAILIWATGLMADPKFETEFNLLSLYSCVAWTGSKIRDCLVGLCLLCFLDILVVGQTSIMGISKLGVAS